MYDLFIKIIIKVMFDFRFKQWAAPVLELSRDPSLSYSGKMLFCWPEYPQLDLKEADQKHLILSQYSCYCMWAERNWTNRLDIFDSPWFFFCVFGLPYWNNFCYATCMLIAQTPWSLVIIFLISSKWSMLVALLSASFDLNITCVTEEI